MKKRIISLLLAVIMIVGMVPFAAIPAMAAGENGWSHIVHYGKYGVLVSILTSDGIGEGETVGDDGYAMPFNSEADLLYAIATVPSHMDRKSLNIILSKDVTISSLKIDAASDNKYCFDIQGGAEGLDEYRNLQLWTAQTSGAKVFTLKYYDKYDAYDHHKPRLAR